MIRTLANQVFATLSPSSTDRQFCCQRTHDVLEASAIVGFVKTLSVLKRAYLPNLKKAATRFPSQHCKYPPGFHTPTTKNKPALK
jgi:hypothetical protein